MKKNNKSQAKESVQTYLNEIYVIVELKEKYIGKKYSKIIIGNISKILKILK